MALINQNKSKMACHNSIAFYINRPNGREIKQI